MIKSSVEVPVVDVDDPSTWPSHIHRVVSQWAERCSGIMRHILDLPLSPDDEPSFRELFTGYWLRAYHFTRLLEHERLSVLRTGLRPLSAGLLSDRIESARAVGAISGEEAAELHQAHVFATGEQLGREGQICLSLSRRVVKSEVEAYRPLLETWGGEGLYMSSGAGSHLDRLRTLGSPAVVIAHIDLGERMSNHLVFPALHKVFVGSLLGLDGVQVDVFYRASIPAEHIESIQEIPWNFNTRAVPAST